MKMTKDQAIEKYSEGLVKLLEQNLWIQSFRKTEHLWDDYIKDLWIPSLSYLWKLCEVYVYVDFEKNKNAMEVIGDKIRLSHTAEGFKVVYENCVLYGDCPEEVVLKLFIELESGK